MKRFALGGVAGAVLAFALVAVYLAFHLQIVFGYLGMPRRYHNYSQEAVPAAHSASPETSPTGRVPQFENATVKVWRTVVAPGSPTAMHRHDHPRIVVALTDGRMAFVGSDGKREEARWEAGKAYWLPAMPPGAMHSDVNAGEEALAVMVVELEKE